MKNAVIFLLISFLPGCGGLELHNHKVERLGILGALGFNEGWTITGTIQNTSNRTHRDITLLIKYQDSNGEIIGDELIPLDITVGPKATERFKVKTQHAPKEIQGYVLSIASSNKQ